MIEGQVPRKGQELRALSWTALSSIGAAAITLGRAALLARLLTPEDFGLFGLTFFAVTALSTLTDFGLARLIIVAKFDDAGHERRFLDTAWTAQVLRSVVLMLLVAALAVPYAASVHQPRLVALLVTCGSWLIITALASPASFLLYRRLEQRALALIRLGSDLFGLLAAAVLAWRWPSVWALVIGWLAGAAVTTLFSYVVHPYRPRFSLDPGMFRRGFAQGRHIAVVAAMTFVTTQVDNYFVGRILGPAALGLYLFAYRLAALPVELLQAIVSSVAMPAFARHRDEGVQVLTEQLRRIMVPTTAVLCGGLVGGLLAQKQLVQVLGGDRWQAAAALLLPLFLVALLRSTAIQMGTLLQSVGRAELDARGKIVEAALFIPGCALAVSRWGLLGACWAGVAVYALAVVLRTWAIGAVLPGQRVAVTLDWARCAVVGCLCAAAGLAAENHGASVLWIAPAAVLTYSLAVAFVQPQILKRLQSLAHWRGTAAPIGD